MQTLYKYLIYFLSLILTELICLFFKDAWWCFRYFDKTILSWSLRHQFHSLLDVPPNSRWLADRLIWPLFLIRFRHISQNREWQVSLLKVVSWVALNAKYNKWVLKRSIAWYIFTWDQGFFLVFLAVLKKGIKNSLLLCPEVYQFLWLASILIIKFHVAFILLQPSYH